MKWFETDGDIDYNDKVLDFIFNFLNEFSNMYQKELGRKPTIEELEYLLKSSFVANVDNRIIANFEEKKIEDIKFKIGKRKRKLNYKVGDICTIPLKCGGYAFSRIIMLQPPSWYLSEILAYYSKDKTYRPYIEEAKSLCEPIFITPNTYIDWQSDIIHRNPEYVYPHLNDLYYYYGDSGNYKSVKIGETKGINISNEDTKKYLEQVYFHPNKILNLIENELKKNHILSYPKMG